MSTTEACHKFMHMLNEWLNERVGIFLLFLFVIEEYYARS